MGEVLNMFAEFEEFYRRKPKFYKRPLLSNTPYTYKKIWITSPNDFHLKIGDDFADEDDEKLEGLLTAHLNGRNHNDNGALSGFVNNRIYVGMPVICTLGTLPNPPYLCTLLRREVKTLHENKKNVDITLVDICMTVTISCDNIFPITVDIFRIPITVVPCSLSYIEPSNGFWPDDLDVRGYSNHFIGDSRVVFFNKQCRDTGRFEVTVEVNHVNLALKYLHQAFRVKDLRAKPIKLPIIDARVKDTDPPRFPLNDLTPWIGFKFMAFGVKVFQDDGNRVKCCLQVFPDMVNSILTEIDEYSEKAEEMRVQPPSEIAPGVCCLVKDEYFNFSRARILGIVSDGKVLVDLVDYKDTREVITSDLFVMPDQLLQYPEGAKTCLISDFLEEPCTDIELLTELVQEKDLYIVIDDCDPDNPEAELKVSLFHCTEEVSGKDISFKNIFNVSKAPVPPKRLLQEIDVVNDDQADYFLGPRLYDPNLVRSKAKFTLCRNEDSICFRSEDEDEVKKFTRITAELNDCYENFVGSPSGQTMGKYVAVKQTDDDKSSWYRAKVMEQETDRVKLLYLDIGKMEWVEKLNVIPLDSYFLKDRIIPFQFKLVEN